MTITIMTQLGPHQVTARSQFQLRLAAKQLKEAHRVEAIRLAFSDFPGPGLYWKPSDCISEEAARILRG